MENINLSLPEEAKKKMDKFPDVNWSEFIRKCIESKAKELKLKQEMSKKLKEEDESGFTDWTIEMGRKVNKGISKRLKEENR